MDEYVPPTVSYSQNRKRMDSLRMLYNIGTGPSASHTLGPRRAAQHFERECADLITLHPNISFRVTFYGVMAQVGTVHLTDVAVYSVLGPRAKLAWVPNEKLQHHPNGMIFDAFADDEALARGDKPLRSETYYSVGGGAILLGDGNPPAEDIEEKPTTNMYEGFTRMNKIAKYCREKKFSLIDFVYEQEGPDLKEYLKKVWATMVAAIECGLPKTQPVEASRDMKYPRKAYHYLRQAKAITDEVLSRNPDMASIKKHKYILAYAMATSQENASATTEVVAAPAFCCSGVVPGVFYYYKQHYGSTDDEIVDALAAAGLIGNLAKSYASILGADCGCQAEIGVATAMAAAGCIHLLDTLTVREGGTHMARDEFNHAMEYAAVMALKHNLGLTCDPVRGLVVVPCIERNGMAALYADDCAETAFLNFADDLVSWDEVLHTMFDTGISMNEKYKDTSQGGLAITYVLDEIRDGAIVVQRTAATAN